MKLPQINWPTVAILGIFLVAWVVLAALHLPVPVWMMAAGAVVGKVIVAIAASMSPGSNGGSGSGTAPPAGE